MAKCLCHSVQTHFNGFLLSGQPESESVVCAAGGFLLIPSMRGHPGTGYLLYASALFGHCMFIPTSGPQLSPWVTLVASLCAGISKELYITLQTFWLVLLDMYGANGKQSCDGNWMLSPNFSPHRFCWCYKRRCMENPLGKTWGGAVEQKWFIAPSHNSWWAEYHPGSAVGAHPDQPVIKEVVGWLCLLRDECLTLLTDIYWCAKKWNECNCCNAASQNAWPIRFS